VKLDGCRVSNETIAGLLAITPWRLQPPDAPHREGSRQASMLFICIENYWHVVEDLPWCSSKPDTQFGNSALGDLNEQRLDCLIRDPLCYGRRLESALKPVAASDSMGRR
jgi:hypothetical protein